MKINNVGKREGGGGVEQPDIFDLCSLIHDWLTCVAKYMMSLELLMYIHITI